MVYGTWISLTIWSSSALMFSGHCLFYLEQYVPLISLCIHCRTHLLCLIISRLPGAIIVYINHVLLIFLFIKKKKANCLGALWIQIKHLSNFDTFQSRGRMGGIRGYYLRHLWLLRFGSNSLYCGVCAFTWSLCFSGLCLATQTYTILSP